jgi:quercetin dioxygenase-like cupin family protein
MNRVTNRRNALKTFAATGLSAVTAARLEPSALAQTASPASAFESRRSLENSFWVGPNLFSFLAEGKTTGGEYTMVDAISPPGAVIAPHTHTREDEILFILEGELEVTLNGAVSYAKPGDHRFMPRGGVHSFKITSPTPARVLVTFIPGGLEGAYKQIAKPAQSLNLPPTPPPPTPEQLERVAKIFASYGYYINPPTR